MLGSVKAFIRGVPVLGSQLANLRRGSTGDYWNRRYLTGGNSGPGSYGRLAQFKSDFLNRFVEENHILSVIEYGCGDGAQLSLVQYPRYVGVDVSLKAVEMCRDRFASDATKEFLQLEETSSPRQFDLALSLDVIYHLVEDAVYEAYMRLMLDSGGRYAIVYSSNMDQEWPAAHVRHRDFTRWIAANRPEWILRSVCENPYPYDPSDEQNTSFANFYVFERCIAS